MATGILAVVILASVCKVNSEICIYKSNDWDFIYTKTKACTFGCCDYDCCFASIGLIVGLVVTGVILTIVVCVIICACRRRNGVVIHSGQTGTVVQQCTVTTQQGAVITSGVQPGVIYPPNPNYPAYPSNYGYDYPPNNGTGFYNVPPYTPQQQPYETTSHSQNQN